MKSKFQLSGFTKKFVIFGTFYLVAVRVLTIYVASLNHEFRIDLPAAQQQVSAPAETAADVQAQPI